MLCPRPKIFPFLSTKHAPIGTPPSLAPFFASSNAALKPGSSADGDFDAMAEVQGVCLVIADDVSLELHMQISALGSANARNGQRPGLERMHPTSARCPTSL
jgi:hypothetical protein